ncbi:MAG TPA: helix-turn-helix domain-containing protein, partial [Candidatus Angelobacter sp.]
MTPSRRLGGGTKARAERGPQSRPTAEKSTTPGRTLLRCQKGSRPLLKLEEWMDIRMLRKEGHSIKAIARQIGRSRNTV